MIVTAICSGCGKQLRGGERFAGKRIACPVCKTPVDMPAHPSAEEEDEFRLLPEETRVPVPIPPVKPSRTNYDPRPVTSIEAPSWAPMLTAAVTGSEEVGPGAPAPADPPASPLLHLCWVFAFTLVPLIVMLFADFVALGSTKEAARKAIEQQEDKWNEVAKSGEQSPEEMKKELEIIFHQYKQDRAFLPPDTILHWPLAFIAAAFFLAIVSGMGMDGSAQPWQLLILGILSATLGIMFLLTVQRLAIWSLGFPWGGRGLLGAVIGILKLIGFSYYAAHNPEMGFFPSLFGYTFGVGLCEEVIKVLPVYVFYRMGGKLSSRGAILWGLALGVGFGVSEGIHYSAEHYNGAASADIYFVRFLSCVSLHAMWTAMAAMMISFKLDHGIDHEELHSLGAAYVLTFAVPIILHGLYDTLLTHEMYLMALLSAVVTFMIFAWLVFRGRKDITHILEQVVPQ